MKKELPFVVELPICSYHITAFYLGVLNANNINTDGMVMNHYVKLSYWNNNVDFFENTYIKYHGFELIKVNEINLDNLKKYIDMNYYVVVVLNKKFINNSECFEKMDDFHDFLVYGYNDINEELQVVGYVSNIFLKFKIKYITFNKCIENSIEKFDGYIEMKNHVFRIASSYDFEKPNIEIIKENLIYNLKQKNGGLHGLRLIQLNTELLQFKLKNNRMLNYITFKIICEHYFIMKHIFEFINVSDWKSYKDFISLEKEIKLLPYLAIKYNYTKDNDIKKSISKILKKLIFAERQCTKLALKCMDL